MDGDKLKTIKVKGNNYVTVNERVRAFRTAAEYAGWSLQTIVHELTNDVAVFEAKVLNKDGRLIANGFAREVRTQAGSIVNATSYVENCETSAWGRALGNLGIGIDESICSAQEMLVAIGAQQSTPATETPKPAPRPAPTPAPQPAPTPAPQPAPVVNKGGAIYPAAEDDDYTAILAEIQSAEDYNMLVRYMRSDRVQKSPYVAALRRVAHNFAKQKGWE